LKAIGATILVTGIMLGIYALAMNVGIDVPAKDLGFGISTPAMTVANIDLMSQRQSYLIFSGILSVVGAILLGFGAMSPKNSAIMASDPAPTEPLPKITKLAPSTPGEPISVSICPQCRHMGPGNATACDRCGAAYT
jgi:hypothetical protein